MGREREKQRKRERERERGKILTIEMKRVTAK